MKKNISFLLSIFVLFTVGAAGSYDYLGPNRSTTTYVLQRKACYWTADGVYGGIHYGCHATTYAAPDADCPSAAGLWNSGPCGWPNGVNCGTMACSYGGPSVSIEGCSSGDQGCRSVSVTTTLPEATVSSYINCSLPGSSGWCRGAASLEISSNEPVPGFNILTVEGTRNGASFACTGTACSVPLLEGGNDFTFWALSSWGDSSGMGSASMSVDTQPPFVSGSLSGVAGSGGWFVSNVQVSASASDATSGIGSVVYSLDGGAPAPYFGPFTVGEGSHSVVFTATDVAGNSSSTSVDINVDLSAPSLAISPPSGMAGAGGWFLSSATVSASAGDGISGLASFEYSVDGGPSAAYAGPITLGDGTHTVVFTATDQAGNSVSGSSSASVDTRAPQLTLTGPTSFCPGCTGAMALNYSVSDADSGVTVWSITVDGIILADGTSAETGTIDWDGSGLFAGPHTITLTARDLAGNLTQTELVVTLVMADPIEPTHTRIQIFHQKTSTFTQTPGTSGPSQGQSSGSTPTAANPSATRTNAVVAFLPPTGGTQLQNPTTSAPVTGSAAGVLFGAEAAAAIGAAMSVIVAENKRRKEEEARAAEESMRFNASQIALEAQRAQSAYAKKTAELEQQKAEYSYKLNLALSMGLSYNEIGNYQNIISTQGYAAAIAALDRYIVGAQEYLAAQAQLDEQLRQQAEAKRKLAEQWLADNAKHTQAEMAAVEAENQRKAAEAAAAAADANKSWWDKFVGKVSGVIGGVVADLNKGFKYADPFKQLHLNDLGNRKVSVSVDAPAGDKLWYKSCLAGEGFDLTGTTYKVSSVAFRTGAGLLKGSISNPTVATAGIGSFLGNMFEYGYGNTDSPQDLVDSTVGNQDFWASTVADTIISVGVGIAAAAVVAGGIAVGALLFGVTAPLWAPVAATAVLAVGAGLVLEATGVNEKGKDVVNQAIDAVKSWWPF
jgi:hypothetical protein